ncbi:hypothetical protein G4V39_04945 [Thermosulfuriphilus ammonigenes]|uniref:Uncharacterized protein n=1 Tax=Thermosulfuriphilus ammonigenes TaxID=1936021 RepID=A0A6G7PVS2_9BACT|nr:Wzz/FepE/Etk N-terminal domain-containing protein [Thermosulfuriphilus ammonigenes]MBA2848169.1 uncharacterized protein involved in exopolysaccharide biosynthesis [Thermosulfuriphilus ammonigenes]QIJ71656.1 hypothetical protein G4V39_04945 [Thermosulfuriphilus ammonigenes]
MEDKEKPLYHPGSSLPPYEEEIDLADIFAVLWRRRRFILGFTSLCLLVAGLYCFLSKPLYKISMQIRPGITGFDNEGNPISDWTVEDLQSWINEKAYISFLLKEFKGKEMSEIKAKSLRKGTLVTLTMYHSDPSLGQKILNKVVQSFASDAEEGQLNKLGFSRQKVTNKIATLRRKRNLALKEKERRIHALKDAEDRSRRLREKISKIEENAADLLLVSRNFVQTEESYFLIQANIIQQNVLYSNLNQYLNSINEEVLLLREEVSSLDEEITSLEAQIADWKARLALLSPVEIIQPPFASPKPVKPEKAKILALSLVAGLFMAVFLAFFLEFLEKSRDKIRQQA